MKRDGSTCVVTEVRLSAGSMERLDDPDWHGSEQGVGITVTEFIAWKQKTRLRKKPLALFSLHAIARRLQRDPGCTDVQLIADMALVGNIDVENIGRDDGFIIHTEDGGWPAAACATKRQMAASSG